MVWKINLYGNNSTDSPIDPLILFSVAGQHSFAEKSDETDMCNEFFNAMYIIMFCPLALLICGFCAGGYYIYKNGCPDTNCCRSESQPSFTYP